MMMRVVDGKGKLVEVGSVVADLSSGKQFMVERIADGGLLTGKGTNGTNPQMSFVNYLPGNVEVVTRSREPLRPGGCGSE